MSPKTTTPPMQELLHKAPDELAADALRLRGELQRARYAHAGGRLTKTHTLRLLRRRLARTLTAHAQRLGSQLPTPVGTP